MGLLKATYGGVDIPVKITRLDRNLSPSITNNTRSIENVNGGEFTHSTYSPKQIVMEFVFQTLRQGNSVSSAEKCQKFCIVKNQRD